METIIVTDQKEKWKFATQVVRTVSAIDYISSPEFTTCESMRVLNLCQNHGYQSIGYYVSLLAEARNHRIYPSVATIQDLKNTSIVALAGENIQAKIEKDLKNIKSDEFVLSVYFGKNISNKYTSLCYKLYGLFPAPLFRVVLKRKKEWQIKKCYTISIDDIPASHLEFLESTLKKYLTKKRHIQFKNKRFQYDLACLVNPNEKTPPSNPAALERLIQAGEKQGINVEIIQKEEYKTLAEYDALFIRETTFVNHHTYRFARMAYNEGLIVLDDPYSILKCGNKVYLTELLNKHNIPCPQSYILGKHNWESIYKDLPMPCVLKIPDSAFSQGVIKVDTLPQLKTALTKFFKDSELVLAQAFMPTEFDWRIGVLNKKPLFACRYYMAENHWQIYDWNNTEDYAGKDDTVPLDEVPKNVINIALKSSKLIGDGLYGVDIKVCNGKPYVIEVNDNPNIDHGIEDKILGDALYDEIISYFLNKIHKYHEHSKQ